MSHPYPRVRCYYMYMHMLSTYFMHFVVQIAGARV